MAQTDLQLLAIAALGHDLEYQNKTMPAFHQERHAADRIDEICAEQNIDKERRTMLRTLVLATYPGARKKLEDTNPVIDGIAISAKMQDICATLADADILSSVALEKKNAIIS